MVGQHQRLVATDPPRRNRPIALTQARQHFRLLAPGDQPENAPGPIEHGIGQCHAAPSLVDPCGRDVRAGDVEHRIPGHQRCGVAVGAKSQMGEIEHCWHAGDLAQGHGISIACRLQVSGFHWHGVNLIGA